MEAQSIDMILNPPSELDQINKKDGYVDKEEFLKMLIAQLQNQNPLEPMKDQEFLAQMAQFSSLEQLQNLNEVMQQNAEWNMLLSQTINNTMATSLIGREVSAESNSFTISDGDVPEISFRSEGFAENALITIYSESGELVRLLARSDFPAGDNSIAWDGKDSDGLELPDGDYHFTIDLTGSNGETVSSRSFVEGRVEAVKYLHGQAFLLVDGAYVPLAAIREVGEGDG